MIISQKVEDAVNEEAGYLFLQGNAPFLSLSLSCVDRDNHIAEDLSPTYSLINGERQDVGGTTFLSEGVVERLNFLIVCQQDAELRIGD